MDSDVIKDGTKQGHPRISTEPGSATHVIPLKRISLGPAGQSSTKITRKNFVNMLNHIHFMEKHAYARVKHSLTEEEFLVRVSPDPCVKREVTFSFPPDIKINPEGLQVLSLIVDDGKMAMIMPVEQARQYGSSFTVVMGESGLVYSERQTKRFHCHLVDARIEDDTISLTGRLLDFSANSLKVWIDEEQGSFYGIAGDGRELNISLHMLGQVVFNGRCRSLRAEDGGRSLILLPVNTHLARFKARKLRNPRMNLVPTPKATFIHPLSSRRVTFEITDITPSGFSIVENADTTELITGLIIPEITILFAGGFKMTCSAQIVYALKQRRKQCRFGFAIYDMDIVTYNQLFDIYSKAIDQHANVSREVDMDALWEFFFKSGFIYPEKYACLSQYREDFKNTYEKLYHGSQEIFANFTYQHNGKVFGHVSIIKAYERTWMIHHLAATPMGRKRTGLYVLNHILNYFDGLYRMPSIGMDHMIFYFRPENKFPNFFFGGFCRQLKQPKGCSIDCFSYLTGLQGVSDSVLPSGWTLVECTPEDISCLRRYYEEVSGGLMLDAFCIDQSDRSGMGIEQLYGKYNLKRKSIPFVLKDQGKPRAFFVVDESDIGVNLSELLNSIKVIVVDKKSLPWNTLQAALSKLVVVYGLDQIPIMVYPVSYMDDHGIRYDKRYNLWVLNSSYGDDYTEHLKDMARINIGRMLFKYILSRIRKS